MKRATVLASLISCLLGLQSATAGEVTGLVNFTAGTPARAAEVNGNFNAVKTAVDDNHARIGALQDAIGRLMYGDGSAGDLLVSGDVDWTTADTPTNLSFNNCTIQSGATLTVSGGTTLRCAGTFTNDGTIDVRGAADGGRISSPAGLTTAGVYVPHPGDMTDVPAMPPVDNDGTFNTSLIGAFGALGTPKTYILGNLSRLRMGGGGGSGTTEGSGGTGGGLLRVLVNGALSNNGRIVANGVAGAGGGGGGIVMLASRASIDNTGTLSARGGDGSNSNGSAAASGGGGGGIVVLAAPTVEDSGTIDVAGGAAGMVVGAVNDLILRVGGGAGGAGGGMGGRGGNVLPGSSTSAASGDMGYVLTLQQDPLFLVH